MDNKIARRIGQVGLIAGLVLIIFSLLWVGLAIIAAALTLILLWGKCPGCGRPLITLPPGISRCPKCKKPL